MKLRKRRQTDREGTASEKRLAALLDSVLQKTKEDRGPMNEMVETMALLGPVEREKMLPRYGETMPKEISLARRETGVLHRQASKVKVVRRLRAAETRGAGPRKQGGWR